MKYRRSTVDAMALRRCNDDEEKAKEYIAMCEDLNESKSKEYYELSKESVIEIRELLGLATPKKCKTCSM